MRATISKNTLAAIAMTGIGFGLVSFLGCESNATRHEVKRVEGTDEQQKEEIDLKADQANKSLDQAPEQKTDELPDNANQPGTPPPNPQP